MRAWRQLQGGERGWVRVGWWVRSGWAGQGGLGGRGQLHQHCQGCLAVCGCEEPTIAAGGILLATAVVAVAGSSIAGAAASAISC